MSSDDNIDQLLSELTADIPGDIISDAVRDHDLENVRGINPKAVELQDPPNLNEILTVDESLITPTSHNVSVINSACQQVLKEIEHQLLVLLKENRKEQEVVQGFLNAHCKSLNIENTKRTSIKCAGMPYFKDAHGFKPPPNEDVLRKQKQNKLLPIDFISSFPTWNSADAKSLIRAVNNYDIKNPDSIDWMKISATYMEGKYSPSECKSKWLMNLSPTVNRSKWSLKEMDTLKNLSEKYNCQDWDKIASELGTNRTGLQCCIQYMTNTFPTQGKWTDEEDQTLQRLVEKYRVKDYIPWAKIAWYFESRSAKQCQERYAYHLGDIKKGSFTAEEDFIIVYLASKLKNFGEVAKYLPNRVATQVRSRYEYLVQLSMPKFSKEEDELLTKLMAQYPRDWGKISAHFSDRSSVQCRRRWGYLQRGIKLAGDIHSESENEEVCSTAPADNISVEKSNIDAKNYYRLNKTVPLTLKPLQNDKEPLKPYDKLLDYHRNSQKFYYGPKPRVSLSPGDQEKLHKKMLVTIKTLSVDHTVPLSGFNIDTLESDCEFDKEDLNALNGLKRGQAKEFEITKTIIPPNYMTLVGLRSLVLSWTKIKNLANFYSERSRSPSPARKTCSGDRLLCSDAKKLFKSRLKTLFAFPLILSNITPNNQNTIYKPKVRRAVRPLSKLRRKEHAKLMNAAYREKLKALSEKLADSRGEEALENGDLQSTSSNKYKRKRKRSSTATMKSETEDSNCGVNGEPSRKRARGSKNGEAASGK